MKPEIQKISQISSDQSVICILGSDHIPERLALSKSENEFASKAVDKQKKNMFSLILITGAYT